MSENASSQASSEQEKPRGNSELKHRIISGVVLAAVALGMSYLGGAAFALMVMAVGVVISWEWGRIVRGPGFDVVFAVHATSVAIAVLLAAFGMTALGVLALAVGAIVVTPLAFENNMRMSALGVFYAGLPAVALVWLRGSPTYGFEAIILIFLIVAMSDTAAFAVGRTVGGPKLWPRVSPNKTWSGFLGAVVAGMFVGIVYAALLNKASLAWLPVVGAILAMIAQGGDLAESALKRGYGVKDTSTLIPGHGGFMDRMDSMVAVAVTAALIALVANPRSPAEALLFGW